MSLCSEGRDQRTDQRACTCSCARVAFSSSMFQSLHDLVFDAWVPWGKSNHNYDIYSTLNSGSRLVRAEEFNQLIINQRPVGRAKASSTNHQKPKMPKVSAQAGATGLLCIALAISSHPKAPNLAEQTRANWLALRCSGILSKSRSQ